MARSLGIVLIVVIVGLLWTYYYFYAQQHLMLSPEEVISIDIEVHWPSFRGLT